MKSTMPIAGVIRELRRSRMLTGSELAKRSGISRGHLHHIENKCFAPGLRTLEKICGALDIGVARLILSAADPNMLVFEDLFARQVKQFLPRLNSEHRAKLLETLKAAPQKQRALQ